MKKLTLEITVDVEDQYVENTYQEIIDKVVVAAQNYHLLVAMRALSECTDPKQAEEIASFHIWWSKLLRESLEGGGVWVEQHPDKKGEAEKEIEDAYWKNIGVQNG